MELLKQIAPSYAPTATSIIHKTYANINSRNDIPRPVHLVQYDQTLPILEVSLMNGSEKYTLPSGAAVNIRLRKPDGTCVYNPSLGVNSNRQTVYISVTSQMTAAFGDMWGVIEIVLAGAVAATATIPIHVDPNPVSDSAIESGDEYKSIRELVNDAQKAADSASNSAKAAKASETASKVSETASKNSQIASANSAVSAASSASAALSNKNAAISAKNEAISAQNAAQTSKAAAKESEIAAEKSRALADSLAKIAEEAAKSAKDSQISSMESEGDAFQSKVLASKSEENALAYADMTRALYEALLGTTSSESGNPIGHEVTELIFDFQNEQILDSESNPILARRFLIDESEIIGIRKSILDLDALIKELIIKMEPMKTNAIFDSNYNGGNS